MEKTNLKVRRVPIDSLQIDHDYARYHSSKNLEAIEQSLCRFGQIEPLIVQAKNGRVINGNGRLLVMKKLGWIECEVVELEVGDARAAEIRAGLNQTIDYLAEQLRGLDKLLDDLKSDPQVMVPSEEIDDLLQKLEADDAIFRDLIDGETSESIKERAPRQ